MVLKKFKFTDCFRYVGDIKTIHFPQYNSNETSLHVYESNTHPPFLVKRVFIINATEGCKRGFHAHKQCAQLLVCLQGSCRVTVDDGESRKNIVLDQPNKGMLLPPTIWAEQEYEAGTILMVLTDHPYDEADYIRNYQAFLQFRKLK